MGKFRILFGAARLDDPIKGVAGFTKALKVLCKRTPELGRTFRTGYLRSDEGPGSICRRVDSPSALRRAARRESHKKGLFGMRLRGVGLEATRRCPALLSKPTGLRMRAREFRPRGQRDIVDHKETGYIAEWNEDEDVAASRIADGLIWAANAAGENSDSVWKNFGALTFQRGSGWRRIS